MLLYLFFSFSFFFLFFFLFILFPFTLFLFFFFLFLFSCLFSFFFYISLIISDIFFFFIQHFQQVTTQNSVQWSPLSGILISWSCLSWHALQIDESSKIRSGAHTPYSHLLVLPPCCMSMSMTMFLHEIHVLLSHTLQSITPKGS